MTEMFSGLDAGVRERVAVLREQGRFFWLDVSLGETGGDDLVDALRIPERALPALAPSADASAARSFHADGESVVFALRCYAGSETPTDEDAFRLRPLDVRVLVTADYLLTLHYERVSLPEVLAPDLPEERSKPYVVYAVLEAMLVTTSEALAEVERRLDALGLAWTEGSGTHVSRKTLRAAGSRLATMRSWVSAEEAVFARIGVEIRALRGFETQEEPYFDRLYEQVNRLLASVDAAANGLAMLLDLQLNQRAYVVSVVATIFVPLTLLTGFFGMNFGWMVDQIETPIAFWLLGALGPIAVAALCWRFLVRRLLLGD